MALYFLLYFSIYSDLYSSGNSIAYLSNVVDIGFKLFLFLS